MAQDFEALGKYTDAEDKMKRGFTDRHNLANDLVQLANKVTGSTNISGAVVQRFDASKAQDIVTKMSKIETDIAAALDVMKANATKCGKQVMRLSDD